MDTLNHDASQGESMAVFKIMEIMEMGIAKEEKRREYYGKVKQLFPKDNALYYEVSQKEFLENVKSRESAILIAMSFEKDSILFFSELRPLVHEQHRDIVEKFIEEEKQHLVYLAKLKKEVTQAIPKSCLQ
jgi:rubrerythrin